MKLLHYFSILLFLCFFSACSEDLAEDGTKRGTVNFAGNTIYRGKEYAVFAYSRMETIESADQSTGYFYYWLTYTLDAKNGKVVHQTEYSLGDQSGNFRGISDQYAFFSTNNELYAIDLFQDNTTLGPNELKQLVKQANPSFKSAVARLEIDSYRNLRALTSNGDIYLLNRSTLTGKLVSDQLQLDPAYRLSLMENFYGETQLIGNANLGYILSDTATLMMQSLNPSNSYQKFLYKVKHPDRHNYLEMMRNLQYEKIDSSIFLEGHLLAYQDSLITLTFRKSLVTNAPEQIGTYDLCKHRFSWSTSVQSLYPPEENNTSYVISWNPDGTSFFIGATSNNYVRFSLIDAQTGHKKWTF